jgi:type I restriction enzyme S subunit
MKIIRIDQVAKINPPKTSLKGPKEQPVTFVPMSAVSEDTKQILAPEIRQWKDVSTGYTPFLEGDIIVAKITPCFENGKMAHAKGLPHPIAFGSTEFHVIRANEQILPGYLFHLLQAPNVIPSGIGKMRGTAGQKRVPDTFFRKLMIPLPDIKQQRHILNSLDTAFSLLLKHQLAAKELDNLMSAIRSRAFRGDL